MFWDNQTALTILYFMTHDHSNFCIFHIIIIILDLRHRQPQHQKINWQSLSFEVKRVAIGEILIAPFTLLDFHRTPASWISYRLSSSALEIAKSALHKYVNVCICVCIYRGPRGQNWGQKLMQPQRSINQTATIQLDLSTRALVLFVSHLLSISYILSANSAVFADFVYLFIYQFLNQLSLVKKCYCAVF